MFIQKLSKNGRKYENMLNLHIFLKIAQKPSVFWRIMENPGEFQGILQLNKPVSIFSIDSCFSREPMKTQGFGAILKTTRENTVFS